jgi:hypothetical protein
VNPSFPSLESCPLWGEKCPWGRRSRHPWLQRHNKKPLPSTHFPHLSPPTDTSPTALPSGERCAGRREVCLGFFIVSGQGGLFSLQALLKKHNTSPIQHTPLPGSARLTRDGSLLFLIGPKGRPLHAYRRATPIAPAAFPAAREGGLSGGVACPLARRGAGGVSRPFGPLKKGRHTVPCTTSL